MSELKADELEHIAYMQTLEIQSLNARITELEAERIELRKILGWAYDLDEYKDNPEERER